MGMQVPEDLRDIMELVGIDWPDIDEDELRDTAREYREFGEELRDTIRDSNRACSHVTAGRSRGKSVDAFQQRWGRVSGRDMKDLASAVDLLADAMDTGATYVTVCKAAIIANLASTAATLTAGAIAAFFTAGLSALLGAAAAAALKQVIKEAIDLLISHLTELAVEKIEKEVLGALEGLFDGHATSGGKDGKGNSLPEGSDALGQDLWVEFREFADAIRDLGEEHDRFTEKKSKFDSGRAKRSLVSKKDDRFAKYGTAIDKAEDKIERTAHKMQKEIEKNVDGLDKTQKNHKNNEQDTKDQFDRCGRHGDDDDVPMYLLSTDGSVQQLTPDGKLVPVDKNDTSGINDLIGADGKAWRPRSPESNPYPISDGGPGASRVNSNRLGHGETNDLAEATQMARYAKGDYGGGNYAAGRYVDDDGDEIILVGHSKGVHSERTIGYPLLKTGNEDNLTALYTEREPCQKAPSYCDQWMAKYFDEDLNVSHSVGYDQSATDDDGNQLSKYKIDAEHRQYRKDLEAWHKDHGVDDGMMTR